MQCATCGTLMVSGVQKKLGKRVLLCTTCGKAVFYIYKGLKFKKVELLWEPRKMHNNSNTG